MSADDFDLSEALANVSIVDVLTSPERKPNGERLGSPDRLRSPAAAERVAAAAAVKPRPGAALKDIPQLDLKLRADDTEAPCSDLVHSVNGGPEQLGVDTKCSISTTDFDAFITAFSQLRTAQALPHTSAKPLAKVVLSPLSYKHVFPRLWLPKRTLGTVVERPERLNACALGIGSAATLVPLEVAASTRRTSLRSEHVVAVHGTDWPDKLYRVSDGIEASLAEEEVEVPDDWPSGDIYMAPQSIVALEAVVAALEDGVDHCFAEKADQNKRVFVCARPPGHHCTEDLPSGFCIINNAHIAIQYARIKHKATHAVILDFDLHHGDGSQSLCWKFSFSNDKTPIMPIGYFSIHDIHSFPTERGCADAERVMAASACLEGHDMAIWNVHLQPWDSEAHFHQLYDSRYSALFKKAASFLQNAEDAAKAANSEFRPLIVISAGFDGSEFEAQTMQRHQVSVPTSFFNRFTIDCGILADRYAQGRVLSLLEGGYSTQALATGVLSHLTGLAGKTWQSSWASAAIADEFLKGSRSRWKRHSEFPGHGIELGRCLFPDVKSHTKEATPVLTSQRVLRTRTQHTQHGKKMDVPAG